MIPISLLGDIKVGAAEDLLAEYRPDVHEALKPVFSKLDSDRRLSDLTNVEYLGILSAFVKAQKEKTSERQVEKALLVQIKCPSCNHSIFFDSSKGVLS